MRGCLGSTDQGLGGYVVGVNVGKCTILYNSTMLHLILHKKEPRLLKSRVFQQSPNSEYKSVWCLLSLRLDHDSTTHRLAKGARCGTDDSKSPPRNHIFKMEETS